MRRAPGFTLLEVVIAVGITAMIGALITAAFQSGYRAKELVESEADKYRALRTGTDRMVREITSAFVSDLTMSAGIADFERDLIRERATAGREALFRLIRLSRTATCILVPGDTLEKLLRPQALAEGL